MLDIRSDLTDTARALERLPTHRSGRIVMIMGARRGDGVSSVAASLAVLLSGRSPRSTWLVDLNLLDNVQFKAFQGGLFPRLGRPGRALDASLKAPQFYQVVPQLRAVAGQALPAQRYLAAHRIENSNLFVTQFRTEFVKPGQKVQIRPAPDYWQALRRVSDWAVIDTPSPTVSSAGLAISRYVDGVVLVVEADGTHAHEVNSLRDEIEAHGGKVIGVVVNRVRADARLADRFAF